MERVVIPGTEPVEAEQALGKLTDRFLAYLVDTVPFGMAYYGSAVGLMLSGRLPNEPASWRLLFWAWLGAYLLYHSVGNALGATPGKWLLGLRVRDLEGRRLGAGRSVLRAAGLLLSTPLNAGFLWAFVQAESRTWHDLLAGSRVVEARPKSRPEALLSALASFLLLGSIIGSTWWFYAVRPTPEDLAAVERARAGLGILAEIEERVKRRDGAYTRSLATLAQASGDVDQFRTGMSALFDPHGFRIAANRDRYQLSGRARDRRRTVVSLSGP